MRIVAPLKLRVAGTEAYVPLVRVTVPVGVGLPLTAMTATFTSIGCVEEML
jgi:hypothetical protein